MIYEEYEKIVGSQLATVSMQRQQGAFDQALNNAWERITAITGVAKPVDMTTAPEWSKEPAAFIIAYKTLGRNSSIDRELRLWLKDQYMDALATLNAYRISTPAGRSKSQVGDIEGLVSWQ